MSCLSLQMRPNGLVGESAGMAHAESVELPAKKSMHMAMTVGVSWTDGDIWVHAAVSVLLDCRVFV